MPPLPPFGHLDTPDTISPSLSGHQRPPTAANGRHSTGAEDAFATGGSEATGAHLERKLDAGATFMGEEDVNSLADDMSILRHSMQLEYILLYTYIDP